MTGYTSRDKLFCSVFKSPKKSGMYIYVNRQTGVSELPELLLTTFGAPIHVLDMILTPTKKLARVDAKKVLDAIADTGFYLQMPTIDEPELLGDCPAPSDTLHG